MSRAYNTGESLPIEMSELLKNGSIQNGCIVWSKLFWNESRHDGKNWICVLSDFTGKEKYIRLIYETIYPDGEKKNFDCKIFIKAVPSNIGKGEILYFICPVTGQKCRILYKAYDSTIWKCRAGYNQRIYYPLQQCSKDDRCNTKYRALDEKLSKLSKKRKMDTYNGIRTKRAIKKETIIKELYRLHELKFSIPDRLLPFC